MRWGLLGLCLDSLRFKLLPEGASGEVGMRNPGVGVGSTQVAAALLSWGVSVPHSLNTLICRDMSSPCASSLPAVRNSL